MTEHLFKNVAGPQNCNLIKKRLQHRFLLMNFVQYSKTSILCGGSMNGWFWGPATPVELFKNTLFYRTFPVAAFDSFSFPACNYIKWFQQRLFSVNFAKFLRTSFDRTPPDDCFLCLSKNLEKFFRSPLLYKLLVACTSCRISTTTYNKKCFTSAFQAFYTKTRCSYSKAFICLKSLKKICE